MLLPVMLLSVKLQDWRVTLKTTHFDINVIQAIYTHNCFSILNFPKLPSTHIDAVPTTRD